MTRPRKATVDYFPHACNHGKTMFILEEQWGNDGYAFWFKLLEILGTSEKHFYDAGNPAAWRFLTAKTRVSSETAADILQCLADLDAIDPDLWSEKIIWSQNFVDGIKEVYRKRAEDIPILPDIRRRKPQSDRVSSGIYPQSKVKESKEKNSTPLTPRKRGEPDAEKINFEKLWNTSPAPRRLPSKAVCFKSYQKAIKQKDYPGDSAIIEAWKYQAEHVWNPADDGKYIPHMSTWLNQCRWDIRGDPPTPTYAPDPDCPYCQGRGVTIINRDNGKTVAKKCRCIDEQIQRDTVPSVNAASPGS